MGTNMRNTFAATVKKSIAKRMVSKAGKASSPYFPSGKVNKTKALKMLEGGEVTGLAIAGMPGQGWAEQTSPEWCTCSQRQATTVLMLLI